MKEKRRSFDPNRKSPFSLIFYLKVSKQTKGKMIAEVIKKMSHIASMNCSDETQSTIHLCDRTDRDVNYSVTIQEINVIFSTFKSFMLKQFRFVI